MIRLAFVPWLVVCSCPIASAQIKLPTVDEALEISSSTGRPVFAMAGQQT